MTANQIIIPICLLIFAVVVIALIVSKRRAKRNAPSQTHSAHSPGSGHDEGQKVVSRFSGTGPEGMSH